MEKKDDKAYAIDLDGSYLKTLGFGSDIIESFNRVYSTDDNINPCEYLDQIPNDKIGEEGVKIFKYKKSRGKI